jgi:hypothetical protein
MTLMQTSILPQTTGHFVNRIARQFLPKVCAAPLLLAAMILSGGLGGCTRQDGPPRLAESGTARYDIAVAADASPVEQTAATQLQSYLKKITGADFPVVTVGAKGSSKPVIAVGPGAALSVAPTLDLSLTELGDDGIVLKTVGENLILTGATGAKRGTLYAVNEFLSKQAGVRWWTPDAETVPANPDLTLQPMDVRYRPAIRFRDTYSNSFANDRYKVNLPKEKSDEMMRFAVRSHANGHFVKIPDSWGGYHPTLGAWPFNFAHTFYHDNGNHGLIAPKKYFKDHPEWFSEIKGQRQWDMGDHHLKKGQLCMTNEAMLEEMARNVLEWLRQNPGADIVAVDINDNMNKCECAKCRAVDNAEGSAMGSVLQGVNRVADIVGAERPDVLLTTMAYFFTRKPPAHIRPRDNVVIRVAIIERSSVQPIDSKNNTTIKRDLDNWAKAAGKLSIWDYSANLNFPFTMEPRFKVFGPDIRFYRDHGAVSILFEDSHGFSPVSDFDQMNTWLLLQLMWNPDQDERALVEEFLAGFYGAAAPFLLEYLDLTATAAAGKRLHSYRQPNADWMNLETMNKATELFNKAQEAVAADPVLAGRVDRARLSLDHQWLLRYADYRREAERKGVPFTGPADLDSGINAFAARCAGLGIKKTLKAQELKDFLEQTRASGKERTVASLLSEDKVYEEFLGGKIPPLPAALADKTEVIQVQDNELNVLAGAKLMLDEKASNHVAAWHDPAIPSWLVQSPHAGELGLDGRWRVFVEVRVEASPGSEGTAFIAGIQDRVNHKSLSRITPQLNPASASPAQRAASTGDPRDGNYHLYDLGSHVLGEKDYVWIGTTGTDAAGNKLSIDPQSVQGIYLDRVIFVPEPKE